MADIVYNAFKGRIAGATTPINFGSDTIKAALVTSSYTPSQDNDDFWDDVSANEVAASGTYSAGGVTLSITASQDNTDNEGVVDATDLSITSFTGTFRYIVLYKSTGVSSTSPLVAVYDITSASVTGGTLTITWNSEGLINIT